MEQLIAKTLLRANSASKKPQQQRTAAKGDFVTDVHQSSFRPIAFTQKYKTPKIDQSTNSTVLSDF